MPTNNDYLSDIANEPRDSGKTNNQLLEKIAAGGSGGGVAPQGKSQVLSANGQIDTTASTILMAGGDTFSLPAPQRDGQLITILNAAGIAITFNGHIGGAQSSTWTTPAGSRLINLLAIKIGTEPTWFVATDEE